MESISRRDLLVVAAVGACACSLGVCGSEAIADEAGASTTTDCGPISDYAEDGITQKWMRSPTKFAVVRQGEKIFATSTICTHRGCIVKVDVTSGGYVCPCHGAKYDVDGNVTHRPARAALERYAVSIDSNNHLIVDKSKAFQPEAWDDAASFVKAPAAATSVPSTQAAT